MRTGCLSHGCLHLRWWWLVQANATLAGLPAVFRQLRPDCRTEAGLEFNWQVSGWLAGRGVWVGGLVGGLVGGGVGGLVGWWVGELVVTMVITDTDNRRRAQLADERVRE